MCASLCPCVPAFSGEQSCPRHRIPDIWKCHLLDPGPHSVCFPTVTSNRLGPTNSTLCVRTLWDCIWLYRRFHGSLYGPDKFCGSCVPCVDLLFFAVCSRKNIQASECDMKNISLPFRSTQSIF